MPASSEESLEKFGRGIGLKESFVDGLQGNAKAYRRFLMELSDYLRDFLARCLSEHPDDVEDLVQETLLAVHLRRRTYDTSRPLEPWLHAIARYKLADWWRRRKTQRPEVERAGGVEGVRAAHAAGDGTARSDVLKLLDTLPAKQRGAIVHTRLEGLSVVEAARITGMSPAAIKVAIHRGLKALAARAK
jgi:RNA polymerase sigma-70 factor (ECF subfamily)